VWLMILAIAIVGGFIALCVVVVSVIVVVVVLRKHRGRTSGNHLLWEFNFNTISDKQIKIDVYDSVARNLSRWRGNVAVWRSGNVVWCDNEVVRRQDGLDG